MSGHLTKVKVRQAPEVAPNKYSGDALTKHWTPPPPRPSTPGAGGACGLRAQFEGSGSGSG